MIGQPDPYQDITSHIAFDQPDNLLFRKLVHEPTELLDEGLEAFVLLPDLERLSIQVG
jgi:hypothetical protein